MHNTENHSIKCTVDTCKYHDCNGYCDLTDITVGCSSSTDAESAYETECMSFEPGNSQS